MNAKVLTVASNLIIQNLISADVASFMEKAESCAFCKHPNDLSRVRPLDISGSLRRFVVSLLMKVTRGHAAEVLAPHQYGLDIKEA